MDEINNSIKHFELLDRLVDENPYLSEEEILKLFNTLVSKHDTVNINLISESIVDESDALINSAFNSEKPTDQYSSAKYKVGDLFKSGGQSDVYFAQRSDAAYNKTVVIKILKQKYIGERERAAFLKEVQILADLQHPNIVNIIDAGFNQKNEPWMILEYINGLQIEEFVINNNLSTKQISLLITDIAQALSYTHKQNVFHLDIKPENIIVRKFNNLDQAILIDFGISLDQNKQPTDIKNLYATPAFASPEQLGVIDADISHYSDVYSIGKLLKVLIKDSMLDADIHSIINCCTQEKTNERYENIQLLVNDLNNYSNQEPVSTRPLNTNQKFWKKFNQRPKLNSVFLLMVVSIMLLFSYNIIETQQHQKLALEQTKRSQYYWGIADNIKNSTRLLYLKPINNIQTEIDQLKMQYFEMELQYNLENEQQKQLVAVAVSQTAISFGFYHKAQKILKFAYNNSPENKNIVLILANNYLNLFQKEQQKSNQYSDTKTRSFETNLLIKKYLNPAQLLFKNKSQQNNHGNIIYKSLLQYLQGNTTSALVLLDKIDKNEIWPIPRLLLASHILSVDAKKFKAKGNNDQSKNLYLKAYYSITEANKIARAHPQVLELKCQIEAELNILYHKVKLTGCDDLIKVLPNTETSIYTYSSAYISLAKSQLLQGQNPQKATYVIESLLSNLSDINNNPQANLILGQINQIRSQWKRNSGQTNVGNIKKAVSFHKIAANLRPDDYLIQTEYAFALFNYGRSMVPYNNISDKVYLESSKILQELLEHADASIMLYVNLVKVLTEHGYSRYQNSLNADEQLSHARKITQSMEEKWPNNSKVSSSKMYIEWTYADYLVFQDKNPEPHLSEALNAFDKIIKEHPNRWVLRYNQISAMLSGVTYFLNHKKRQTNKLKIIKQKLNQIEKETNKRVSHSSLYGYYYNMHAMDNLLNNQPPTDSFIKSRGYNTSCLNNPIDGLNCTIQLATLFNIEHKWLFDNKKLIEDNWIKDISIIDNALHTYSNQPLLLALRAKLRLQEIPFFSLNKEQAFKVLKQSQKEFKTVLKQQPLLTNKYSRELKEIKHKLKRYSKL